MLALCNDAHVPVVAWGAGTSLEGHVTPVRGGITLDLSRMTRIIDVSQPDMDCRVEAGVTRDQLNDASARPGAVLPGRSRHRAVHHRRHVRDARLRHQRGALRHDPRERAGPDRGAGRRPADPHRRARAQVRHRLRPDAAVHRLRGHAGRHHRNPVAPARHPRGDVVRHLPVPHAARRGGDGDRHHADGHSGRAHGTAGRGADGRLHRLFEAGGPGAAAQPVLRIPRHHRRGGRAGDSRRRRSPRATTARASAGPPMPPSATSCGRRGTTRSGRAWR